MSDLISRVQTIGTDRRVYVEIETKDGYKGLGEAGVWSHLEACATVIEKAASYLVGKPASKIEHHWQTLSRFGSYSGSILMGAVSAIDIALWDILGQRLGVPIHALIGGAYRERARVYGQVHGKTTSDLIDSARSLNEAGFSVVGHLNPFLDQSVDEPFDSTFVRRHTEAVAVLERVRETLGDDVDIGVELHRRLNPGEAISFVRALEGIRPMWVEDPIRPGSVEAMAQVQRAVGVPIATGERFYALNQFQHLLKEGGARYLRPSIGLCGGLTGMMKIAALAQAYDAQIIPHNTLSPVLVYASLHAVAAMPNFLVLEYPTSSYLDNTFSTQLRGSSSVTNVPRFAGGYVDVPTEPGLGTALVKDVAQSYPARATPIHMRAHIDGSVVEH